MVRCFKLESEASLVRFLVEAYNFILLFRLLSVVQSSAKPIQMKLSMTFIQSKGCEKIDLIFTNMAAVYTIYQNIFVSVHFSENDLRNAC